MESIVGNRRPSRRFSRTGLAILNRAREEIQTLPLFHSHPHSWYNAGHLVASFLQDLLSDIEFATDFYRQAPGADDDDGELAERVLWALVLMQSERLPGTRGTCLMCASQDLESNERCTQESPRVSMERHLVSSCGYWTLNEISIYPLLRDVDYQELPLCRLHEVKFNFALQAVLGFV